MLKIQKYILMVSLGPFIAITTGLALLALFTQSLTQLDLLIERGQNPLTILSISALATPQFMAVVAPIAIFATIVMVYGRLYSENEIVVGYAGGLSIWQVCQPMIRLATIVAVITLFINLFIQPLSYQTMRAKIFAIRSDVATTLVREAQFREPIKGLTIYTRKIEPGGDMGGLVISDNRNPNSPVSYVAQTGSVVKIQGIPAISMKDGAVHRLNSKGLPEIIGFTQYVMELSGFQIEERELFYKPPDRYTQDLFFPDKTNYWDRAHKGELLAEAHRRFSSPLNSIACAMLALWAILGGEFSRRGFGRQILNASIGMLMLLLAQSGLQGVYADNIGLNIIQYIIPIGTIIFLATKMGMLKSAKAFGLSAGFKVQRGGLNAI